MMRTRPRLLLLLLLLLLGVACAHAVDGLVPAAFPSTEPYAIAGDTWATFSFPVDTAPMFKMNCPAVGKADAVSFLWWAVSWNGWRSLHLGRDPDNLSYSADPIPSSCPESRKRHAERFDSVGVGTVCLTCDGAEGMKTVAGVTATIVARRMMFRVEGRDAMNRVFPGGVPDTVRFLATLSGDKEIDKFVAVRRATAPR